MCIKIIKTDTIKILYVIISWFLCNIFGVFPTILQNLNLSKLAETLTDILENGIMLPYFRKG